MQDMIEYYEFKFKTIHNDYIKYYLLDSNITINEFIKVITERIRLDFKIDDDMDIELIEHNVKYNDIYKLKFDPQCAVPIVSSNKKLREVYYNDSNDKLFYIRQKYRILKLELPSDNIDEIDENDLGYLKRSKL